MEKLSNRPSRKLKHFTSDDVLARLKATRDAASSSQWQNRFNSLGAKLAPDPRSIDHLEHFKSAVFAGAMPSPESLLFIALGIQTFVEAKGAKSLEESFAMPARKGVGNASRLLGRERERQVQLWGMAFLRAANPKLSVAEAARQVAGKDQKHFDILLKQYRKFGPETERAIRVGEMENK